MLLIFEFLSDSTRHVKAGVVTEDELASVPLALKRWVVWPYYLGVYLADHNRGLVRLAQVG
ncbi:hypothetical protein [Pseudomonas sp. 58 R 3]|uniref:hypothetical protein n=1 Tax=Pseudomonas sp. 58 R 3 TaxID=1844108 RepID=UPI0008129563|nr:hypothetical protein [Pseudomonas sp. 58 R 3]CRM71053.1 hypothetical protein [Pseudomonas sp. 58 R 3]